MGCGSDGIFMKMCVGRFKFVDFESNAEVGQGVHPTVVCVRGDGFY